MKTQPNGLPEIFLISLDIGEEKTGSMYYTTDGSNPINEAGEPTATSAKYTDKTSIKLPAFIKCAYVEDSK